MIDKYLMIFGITGLLMKAITDDITGLLSKQENSAFHWHEREHGAYIAGTEGLNHLLLGQKIVAVGKVRYLTNSSLKEETGLNQLVEILNREIRVSELDDILLTAAGFFGSWIAARAENKVITVLRDFPGTLPAYFTRNKDVLVIYSNSEWSCSIEGILKRSYSGTVPLGSTVFDRSNLNKVSGSRVMRHPIIAEQRKIEYEQAADVKKLHVLIENSVASQCKSIPEGEQAAVLLSGGLDSSLVTAFLALEKTADFILYYCGLDNSKDLKYARIVAEHYQRSLHEVIIHDSEIEALLQQVKTILPQRLGENPLHISIAIPLLALLQEASSKGLNYCFAGQGADELFGGYSRYKDMFRVGANDRLSAELKHDIFNIGPANLERDIAMAASTGEELLLPFLDPRVIKFASSLNLQQLFSYSEQEIVNKVILRHLARELGLPEIITERPKKAMQYGSGIMNYLKKQAKRNKSSLREWLA